MTGFVSLVGAGPGDPELLTVKAVRRLREADLLLYDALVAKEILELASGAHCFFVGKRARTKSVQQRTIERLMIRAARAGKRVVRLKSGDPFVFGRGGEEGLALLEAGVPFEVVPGVSSAIAAPGLFGIPVTHRGLSSGFAVISGHSEKSFGPFLEALPAHSLTLVVLMGVATRAALAQKLLERGWSKRTPAALLFAASTPRAAAWMGSLEGLLSIDSHSLPPDEAGTIVVGEVASLADKLSPPQPGADTSLSQSRGSHGF